jgi:hypothetical protein
MLRGGLWHISHAVWSPAVFKSPEQNDCKISRPDNNNRKWRNYSRRHGPSVILPQVLICMKRNTVSFWSGVAGLFEAEGFLISAMGVNAWIVDLPVMKEAKHWTAQWKTQVIGSRCNCFQIASQISNFGLRKIFVHRLQQIFSAVTKHN